MKIIVCIDDEKLSLDTITLICESSGYKTMSFTSPLKGLEYIEKHYTDIGLIFLDLMMPEMYGLNALKKIRNNKYTAEIPVVINSCLSDPEEINKISKFKHTEYINKPFTTSDILNSISTQIETVH